MTRKLLVHELSRRPGGAWEARVTIPGHPDAHFLKFPKGEPPSMPDIEVAAEFLRQALALKYQVPIPVPLQGLGEQRPAPAVLPPLYPWYTRLLHWLMFWRR